MLPVLSDPVGLLYIAVYVGSGLVCLLLIPRARSFDDTEMRTGLFWLLATTGTWGVLKAAYFLVPAPLREPSYTVGLIVGFGTVWSWLYFCSAYTGRNFHRNSTLRRIGVGVFLLVVSAKVTNPIHGLYFTTSEVTSPFPHLAIEHGLLHWSATGLAYVLSAIGVFMIFELYLRSDYDTRPLSVLTVLIALPVVFDIGALLTPSLIDVIYAPVGVAVFATGVLVLFQERLEAVRTVIQDGDTTVYLDGDRRVRDASTRAAELFPALEQATGAPLAEALPEVAAALDTDSVLERAVDGETRYYFVGTDSVGVNDSGAQVLTITDVTDFERQRRQLRRREHELDEQNELYRAIIAASFDFVYRVDPDGRLTFVSASVEDVLGYTSEDLVGRQVDTIASTDEAGEQALEYLDDVADGNALQIRDFPIEHRDGGSVSTDFRVVPIYEAEVPKAERTPADIVGAQGMVRDTTERNRREGLISVINRVLRHNVRNKLTVINGHAKILSADLDGESAESAEQIVESADRLLDLTESARKIEQTRGESLELEVHDIVPIVEEVRSRVEDQYPNVSISVDGPESAVALTLPRIETALFELLDNAAKHSGDAPSIELDVTAGSEQVTVEITDEGPGLPDAEREVLATGTEDPLTHGSGLGLWLAYWFVTSLDGDIESPRTDEGTTVEVGLPTPDE